MHKSAYEPISEGLQRQRNERQNGPDKDINHIVVAQIDCRKDERAPYHEEDPPRFRPETKGHNDVDHRQPGVTAGHAVAVDSRYRICNSDWDAPSDVDKTPQSRRK